MKPCLIEALFNSMAQTQTVTQTCSAVQNPSDPNLQYIIGQLARQCFTKLLLLLLLLLLQEECPWVTGTC
jgi:hypothetical protein